MRLWLVFDSNNIINHYKITINYLLFNLFTVDKLRDRVDLFWSKDTEQNARLKINIFKYLSVEKLKFLRF